METNFKTYTGTKTIKAMPMCVGDAKRAGANVPASYFEVGNSSFNPGAEGYLVEYPDGYRSWSPKKVFEEAYSLSETHVDRMKIELADLNNKICKATTALYGADSPLNNSDNVPLWAALREQLNKMLDYADALSTRLLQAESWEEETTKKGGE